MRLEHSEAACEQPWADNSNWQASTPELILVPSAVPSHRESLPQLKSSCDPVLSITSEHSFHLRNFCSEKKLLGKTKPVSSTAWEESFQDLSNWCSLTSHTMDANRRELSCVTDDELNTPEIGLQTEFDFTRNSEVPRTPELHIDEWNLSVTDMDVLGTFDALLNSSDTDDALIKDEPVPTEDAQVITFENRATLNNQLVHDTFIDEHPKDMLISHEEVIEVNETEDIEVKNINTNSSISVNSVPIIVTFVTTESPVSPDSWSSTYDAVKENFILDQLKEETNRAKEESCKLLQEYVDINEYDAAPPIPPYVEIENKNAGLFSVSADNAQMPPVPDESTTIIAENMRRRRKQSTVKPVLDLKPGFNPISLFENAGINTPDVLEPLVNSNGEFDLLAYCTAGVQGKLPVLDSPDLKHMDSLLPPIVKQEPSTSNTATNSPIQNGKQKTVSKKPKYDLANPSKGKGSHTKPPKCISRRRSSSKLTINVQDLSEIVIPTIAEVSEASTSNSRLRRRTSSQNKKYEEYMELLDDSDQEVFTSRSIYTKSGIKREPFSPGPLKRKRKLSSTSEFEDMPPVKQRCASSCSESDMQSPGCSKYRELRDRNNEASRRSRMNRKSRETEMADLAAKLERENRTLKIKAEEMEKLVTNLRKALLNTILKSKKGN